MQQESYWYNERDDDDFMTPTFKGPDFLGCQTEDKFVTTSEMVNQHENSQSLSYISEGFQSEGDGVCMEKACLPNHSFEGDEDVTNSKDYCCVYKKEQLEEELLKKDIHLNDFQTKVVGKFYSFDSALENTMNQTYDCNTKDDISKGNKGSYDLSMKVAETNVSNGLDSYEARDGRELTEECQELDDAANGEDITDDELLKYTHEDEYEVFDLRIIHRKNRLVPSWTFTLSMLV